MINGKKAWSIFQTLEESEPYTRWIYSKRLYHCNAYILQTPTVYYLMSYSTVIAAYDTDSKTLVEVLRKVYGYTATSNQHFHKFYRWLEEEEHKIVEHCYRFTWDSYEN